MKHTSHSLHMDQENSSTITNLYQGSFPLIELERPGLCIPSLDHRWPFEVETENISFQTSHQVVDFGRVGSVDYSGWVGEFGVFEIFY